MNILQCIELVREKPTGTELYFRKAAPVYDHEPYLGIIAGMFTLNWALGGQRIHDWRMYSLTYQDVTCNEWVLVDPQPFIPD